MYYIALLAVLLPCALAVPWTQIEMAQERPAQVNLEDLEAPVEVLFEQFKQTHNRKYEDDTQERMRRGIFEVNIKYIKEHNEKYKSGEKTYSLGINHFTDLTHREFLHMYTGHLGKRSAPRNGSTFLAPENVVLPDTVDWREKGAVTPVKNQGQCGSCWSFSATGSLEGQHFRKTGKLVSLSEQQLVDCSGSFGNEGCNGGLMDQAFEYVKSVKGIESESDYPYEAKQEDRCKYRAKLEKAECTGYVDIEAGSEDKLKMAVATVGPISVAIDASHRSFQLYKKGVYNEPECSSTQLDHGVLAVGYGTDEGSSMDYWLVKNSWGTGWGIDGYVKMSRNQDNQCGVASQASYPLE